MNNMAAPLENKENEAVGVYLARLRQSRSISRHELAESCAEEFGQDIDSAKDYIRRVELGRKQIRKSTDRQRIKVILRKLEASENEVLQVFNYVDSDEIVELGLFLNPASVTSVIDEIILKAAQLKRILKRYGIEHKAALAPLDLCSSSLDLEYELEKLRQSCEQAGSHDSTLWLIQNFAHKRVPISDLVGDQLLNLESDKKALVAAIDKHIASMRRAREKIAEEGASLLNRLTRIDEIVLADFNVAWLLILELFERQRKKPFPLLRFLESRGRILFWEDIYQWQSLAGKKGWDFRPLPCDQQHIEEHEIEAKKKGSRFVLGVGAEAVAPDGRCLVSQGLRLICEKTKKHPNATVVIAAETFRVQKFEVERFLWGIDQYRQPFTLDTLSPSSYSAIVTDHGSHWTSQMKNLMCCIEKWRSY